MRPRVVAPEWLDRLPAEDPLAAGSRRDLRRLNFWMGHVPTMRRALRGLPAMTRPWRVAEWGAGDGTFFLRLGLAGNGGCVHFIDRNPCISEKTKSALRAAGWKVEIHRADVFDCLGNGETFDIILANLFLHHFEPESLNALFRLAAPRCQALVACEPRRARGGPLLGGLLRLLGCNAVTRHDGCVSVRAGFRGRELSNQWPEAKWILREGRAGFFSHLFVARRNSP